ncbi:hypothetical protein [Algoriphagus confluentis]|uniref:Uncharacterized protein n=1 Tax=Algoriphagus confluentis TaxID=1697556 RepID=A0ABQ6PP56_9BACT|nr:hypothetical protein Aconfl_23940 [Algoriphagus confluentis]
MNENPPKASFLKKIKPELLMAFLAVLISFLTLFVYLYQSSLMKTQQMMSVWPHVTFGPTWDSDYLALNLINKGVGPALVKQMHVEINNQKIEGIQNLMDYVPDSLRSEFNYSSLFPGQVIMVGENIQLFQTSNPKTIGYFLKLLRDGKIRIEVCYCSIYQDCWVSSGISVMESDCDSVL